MACNLVYTRFMGTRGDKTRLKVIEASMACLSKFGIEGTTFQSIADEARISQPLVVYHFKNKGAIFTTVMNHILDTALVETQEALSLRTSAAEQLLTYFDVSLQFVRANSAIMHVYILFYYQSSFREEFRRMNDILKMEATERVLGIIALGMGSGEFKVDDPVTAAKMIHVYLTGLILNLATEKNDPKRDQLLLRRLKHDGLLALGYSGPLLKNE